MQRLKCLESLYSNYCYLVPTCLFHCVANQLIQSTVDNITTINIILTTTAICKSKAYGSTYSSIAITDITIAKQYEARFFPDKIKNIINDKIKKYNKVMQVTVYVLIHFWEEVSGCRSLKQWTGNSGKKSLDQLS